MSWKAELQLGDIGHIERLEITCKKCGLFQPSAPEELLEAFGPYLYLDEVEAHLKCIRWGCGGDVRLGLDTKPKLEGFQGGMP